MPACSVGDGAAGVEIAIDRNTEVTHKMTTKIETLPLNMRPFLAGMFEKSKNLEAEELCGKRVFFHVHAFKTISREVALKIKIRLRFLSFLLLLIPISASHNRTPADQFQATSIPINAGWQFAKRRTCGTATVPDVHTDLLANKLIEILLSRNERSNSGLEKQIAVSNTLCRDASHAKRAPQVVFEVGHLRRGLSK